MAKKQKHPEHVNLERYLISYADFITLLFATFVVLYALSQVDIKGFKDLEKSMQEAFAAPSLMQGADGIMQQNSSNSLFDTSSANSVIAPLMMEYVSQKYEDESMQEIENTINSEAKTGELSGVEAMKTDRGLLIRFNNDYLFKSGSAALNPGAKPKLDKVGAIVGSKFYLHIMRVEGHTDNKPINSAQYPSNWELSSARSSTIIRYLIQRFGFVPSLFTAVGFADTRPVIDNSNENNRAKNRRVEILILKNKFNGSENPKNIIANMSKADQEKMQASRLDTINRINALSDAAEKLTNGDKKAASKAVILDQAYNKEIKRINNETQALDVNTRSKITGQGKWLKAPAQQVSRVRVFNN